MPVATIPTLFPPCRDLSLNSLRKITTALFAVVTTLALSPGGVSAQLARLPTTPLVQPWIGEPSIADEAVAIAFPELVDESPHRIDPVTYVDLDAYSGSLPENYDSANEDWYWQVLPDGVIYRSYLAGEKESRFSANIVYGEDDGWLWDAKMGTRVTILRFGPIDPIRPVGFAIEVDGSAQMRLDFSSNVDVRSGDYRGGIQAAFGTRRHQTRFGYYHLSSHVGDEFLLKNPGFTRLNYARDVIILGHSIYVTDAMRIYAEAGFAFSSDVSQPWEFQFGYECAPPYATGPCGAPFYAINAHLREEVNFGGGLTVQIGWAWRGDDSDKLLRVGVQYYVGKSSQLSFYDDYEEQFGIGLWYDF